MKISTQQVQHVSCLTPIKRYQHSIKMIADNEELYTICRSDGLWELAEVEERVVFFCWSAKEYAQPFVSTGWIDCEIEKLSLKEFMTDIIPFLKDEDYLLNVFSVNHSSGFVITPDEFISDLEIEMKKYD